MQTVPNDHGRDRSNGWKEPLPQTGRLLSPCEIRRLIQIMRQEAKEEDKS